MNKESQLYDDGLLPEINERHGQYIGWNSEIYQEYLKLRQDVALKYRKPFGDFVVAFNVLNDDDSVHSVLTDTFLHDCMLTIDRIVAERSEFGMSEVRMLFAEGLSDREICQDLSIQKITRGMVGDPRAPAMLADAYTEGTLDRKAFLKILRVHALNFTASAHNFEKQVPRIEKEFLLDLKKLIDDPDHPLTSDILSEATIHQRVSAVKVIMGDPLAMATHGVAVGIYNPDNEMIFVAYERPINMSKGKDVHFEKTYRHEMIHALSGRSIVIDNQYHMPHERLGVEENETGFNKWLNEAITEQLTQDLKGKRHNYIQGSYQHERELYKQLLQRIPEELFLKAYFENTETDSDESSPHGQALSEAINKEFGDRFMENLNISVWEKGPEDTLRVFDTL
ncbi:MAG: hypothetical protein V4664_00715 [Patescibacteria group bacterium]